MVIILLNILLSNWKPAYGSGFSKRQIELFRQFYRTFPIANALRSQLGWTHYKILLRLENGDKRDFYIAEAVKNTWTTRQLERQIHSGLWERLLMSNDKENVLAVARNEKQLSDSKEIIKDPMYLEFLGLHREASYYEKDLEQAIISHLHDFLLEMGNGFTFVARQKGYILKAMSSLSILYFTIVFCNVLLLSK